MDASSPRGEQELGGDEEDAGEESNRPASSVVRSSLHFFTQNTNSRKKYQTLKKWLPCFFRKPILVDKGTSTNDLITEVQDESRSPDLQDQREKLILMVRENRRPGFSLSGEDDWETKLSECNWISRPLKRRSPFLDQAPPRKHVRRWYSPTARENLTETDEPPLGDSPRRPQLEALRKDRWKSPSRESPGWERLAKQKRSPRLKNPPVGKSPRWERPSVAKDRSPQRDETVTRDESRRPHKEAIRKERRKSLDRELRGRERSPEWKKSPGDKSPGRRRWPDAKSPYLRLPLWKKQQDSRDRSPRRDESVIRGQPHRSHSEEFRRDSRRSPDRRSHGGKSPRRRSPGGNSPRRKSPRGSRDASPRRGESVIWNSPHHEKKSGPRRHSPSSRSEIKRKRSEVPKVKRKVNFVAVVGLLCSLLSGAALFATVQIFPVCVGKVSWEVMPREAVLLELVSVSLLVIATTSILMLVDSFVGIFTEIIVATILLLYNAAVVDLVRCLCFMPDRCMWLAVLVTPLFLITLFVLCRQKIALMRKPS